MPYPVIILTRKIRIAIMVSLIVAFFIISPIVLLYTAGYRYDFKNHKIKETGVISIDIKPKDATVYLNGVKLQDKIPVRLTNRLPGNYSIKITKEGHQDWQKNITVESKKSSYIKDIILYKENLPSKILDLDDTLVSVQPSLHSRYIANIYKIKNIFEIKILDPKEAKEILVLREKLDSIPEIEWSKNGNEISIKTREENNEKITLFSANKNSIINSYAITSKNGLSKIQWSDGKLFVQDGTKIKIIEENNIETIATSSSTIWFADNKNDFWYIDLSSNNLKTTIDGQEKSIHFPLKNINKIINATENTTIVQNDNKKISIIKHNGKEVENVKNIPSTFFVYNDDLKEWIAWDQWEIWHIYQDGSSKLLSRLDRSIDNISILDKFGNLILLSKNKILAFDPNYHVTHTLVEDAEVKKMWTDIENRTLYFIGSHSGEEGMYELEY